MKDPHKQADKAREDLARILVAAGETPVRAYRFADLLHQGRMVGFGSTPAQLVAQLNGQGFTVHGCPEGARMPISIGDDTRWAQ